MARINIRKKENIPVIQIVDLVKTFGNKTVLKDMNISINQGEFITLLGASGSGKTTALRLIGGFDWPTRGEIKFYGTDVKDLPPHKRPTNTIFQDYALFPHLNVAKNIEYGLELMRVPKQNKSQKQIKKLSKYEKKWSEKSKRKMNNLDILQKRKEEELDNAKKNSFKKWRAQRWMDNSDFRYSYWETYVLEKKTKYNNLHLSRKLSKRERNEKVKNIIKLIGLEGNEKKYIDELSGGMKQRVALARAIINQPQILLLDEPLSALDLKVRKRMQKELKNIQRELGLTFIFVTHDQEEAMTISDRIAVMKNGKIEQFDTPQVIYEFPKNSWVADFVGESNIVNAIVFAKNKLKFPEGIFPGDTYSFKKGHKVKAMLRPEDIMITKAKGFISGKITSATYQGTFWEYAINVNKKIWRARTTKKFKVNDVVNLKWTSYDVHTMEE